MIVFVQCGQLRQKLAQGSIERASFSIVRLGFGTAAQASQRASKSQFRRGRICVRGESVRIGFRGFLKLPGIKKRRPQIQLSLKDTRLELQSLAIFGNRQRILAGHAVSQRQIEMRPEITAIRRDGFRE